MSQITSGIRGTLNHPDVYDFFQNIMGARSFRRKFVREYIQPFPGCKILDIGCGTARILDYLPRDVIYHGYDLSEQYIENARRRYSIRGKFVCSLVSDVAADQMPQFDVVTVMGLLHHIDDDQAYELIKFAQSVLKRSGRLVTFDPCFADGQSPISRFLVRRDRGQNVRTDSAYRGLARKVFPQVTGEVRHQFWIPYTQWIMECRN